MPGLNLIRPHGLEIRRPIVSGTSIVRATVVPVLEGVFGSLDFRDDSHGNPAFSVAAEKVRNHDKLFAKLADAIPELVLILDKGATPVYCNRAFRNYFGLSLAEFRQLDEVERSQRLLFPDDCPRHIQWLKSKSSPSSQTGSFRYRRADGTFRWFRTEVTALDNPDADIEGWLYLGTDIHDARPQETDLASTALEAAMVGAMVSKWSERTLLNASHELRTPLTAILGFSQALLDMGSSDERDRVFKQIVYRNAQNLHAVIEHILATVED